MIKDFRIGSTMPSLISGTSPYGGPWQAFNYSREEIPQKDSVMFQVGREVEDYITRAGLKGVHPGWLEIIGLPKDALETFRFKKTPSVFFEAEGVPYRDTPDGKIVLSNRHHKPIFLIEAKRCQYSDRADWADPLPVGEAPEEGAEITESRVPAYYRDQCQHHMFAHPGVSAVLMPVIFNWTDTPKVYVVFRDNARINELHELCKGFWFEHIKPQIPPMADSSDAMKEYLKHQEATQELYPKAEDEDYLHMYNLMEAKEHLAKIKAVIQERENTLKERVGSNYGLTFFDNGRISFKPNKHGTRTLSYRGVKKELLYAHGGEINE